MTNKDHFKPLWIINFKRPEVTKERNLFTLEEQVNALSYLESMNKDFQKFANLYLKHIEKNPNIEKTLKDMSDRFGALNRLITFIKSLLKSLN